MLTFSQLKYSQNKCLKNRFKQFLTSCIYFLFAERILESTLVSGNWSRMILIHTVIGMAIINPGTPQMKPQSMSMTKTVITFNEKDFPIKIGSKIVPNKT